MKLAVIAMDAGVQSLVVTLGKRGLIYFLAPGFENVINVRRGSDVIASTGPIRTALVPATAVDIRDACDPTGCGDVWGATYFTRMVAGDKFEAAMRAANSPPRATSHCVARRASHLFFAES